MKRVAVTTDGGRSLEFSVAAEDEPDAVLSRLVREGPTPPGPEPLG